MSIDDRPWPTFMFEASERTYRRGEAFSRGDGYPNPDCEVCRGNGNYAGAFGEATPCGCTSEHPMNENGGAADDGPAATTP